MDFFSNQPSQAPDLGMGGLIALVMSLIVALWLTSHFYESRFYCCFFQILQTIQLLAIYSWYALSVGFPLNESLPLYHCRMAMFVVLLWAKPSKFKDYFAFLGLGGTIAAFVYPVFDPYPFWHVTIFSLIFGHLALWANSWAYLMRHDRRQTLDLKTSLIYTLSINALLIWVNQLTGGNYGFLAQAPILNTTNIWLNYGLVSLFITVIVSLLQTLADLILVLKK